MKKFPTQTSLLMCGDEPTEETVSIECNNTNMDFKSTKNNNRRNGNFNSKSLSLTLIDTSREPSKVDQQSPVTLSPGSSHWGLIRDMLATTPPTGKKFSSQFNMNNKDVGNFNKKRKKNRNPNDKQGIPKMSPSLDECFGKFISCSENWNQVLLDMNEVDQGRGHKLMKNILEMERRPQAPAEVLNYDHAVRTESSTPGGIRKQQQPQQISSSLKRASAVDKPKLAKDVPRFYFPEGKPSSSTAIQDSLIKAEEKLKQYDNAINFSKFGELLSAVGIPLYWKRPFWMAMFLSPESSCTSKMFIPFLRYLLNECPDEASRFARIVSSAARNFPEGTIGITNLNNNRNSKFYGNHGDFCQDLKYVEISMSDFIPMVQDIVDTHPGLGFLRDAPEFHSRYVTTVISRIFYKVNRSWSGRITMTELRRSNLLRVIKRLEEETDINSITEYFSYEHFYVIYCKFWELDKDHDLLIDKNDLAAHADHALSSRIIDRIFSGTVLRGWDVTSPIRAANDKMTYSDFVWFLLSEEDKKTLTAIEYWFRCLDVDGDGILSPYELQYFYSEQEHRIESLGIEPLHFSNVYCQLVDMLHCSPTGVRLKDLKRNAYLAPNVFNTLFNLDKYLEHEQRDPFAAAASLGNPEGVEGESDWDKYAATEYELLIAEENPSEHLHDSGLEDVLTP